MGFDETRLDLGDSGSHNDEKYGKFDIEGHGGPCIHRPPSLSPNLYGCSLPVGFFTWMFVLLKVAEVNVPRIFCSRNSIARSIYRLVSPGVHVGRPLVASLAAVCLSVLPALADGEPKEKSARASSPSVEAKSEVVSGALVIVGGGGFPDDIRDRFLQLAGGKKGHLVVIPTASELEVRTKNYFSFDYWKAQGLASVSLLHTLDPKEANDPSFVKPLKKATAVWLDGGDQALLAKAYHGTAVEKELRNLLANGGVIGGTSAGASIMSDIMIAGGERQVRVGQGFGLLPNVVIDQHFRNRQRQKRLLSVLAKNPRCLGLGIDEETAVVVKGNTFTVLGKDHVSVCLPPTEHDAGTVKLLKSGEEGNLLKLSEDVMARLKTSAEGKSIAAKTTTTP
jgi:cyanophycinase